MRMLHRFAAVLFLCTPSVWAVDAASSAAAEALFSDARALLEKRDFAAACPKFAESQRLDPGTGTLMNLADCYEQGGQLASAWTTWLEAGRSARSAGQTDREELAKTRAKSLEGRLGRLTIQVGAQVPPGLKITRAGVELASATWGSPLPVDAGAYPIEATAPGYKPFSSQVTVVDGKIATIVIPALEVAPAEPARSTRRSSEDDEESSSDSDDEEDEAPVPGKAQRTWGWVANGVGAAGVVIGAISGLTAIGLNNSSLPFCDQNDPTNCDQTGVELRDSALAAGNFSTAAFVVGGVLIAGGVTLIVTAPKAVPPPTVHASAGPGGAFLSIRGSF